MKPLVLVVCGLKTQLGACCAWLENHSRACLEKHSCHGSSADKISGSAIVVKMITDRKECLRN